jgi:ribose transport system permease protein
MAPEERLPKEVSARPRLRVRPARTLDLLERLGLLALFAVLMIYFALDGGISDVFFSGANIRTVLANQAVVGVVALAMVVPLVSGYFDLSAAATVGVSNILVADLLANHGWPIAAVIVIGPVVGAGVGLTTGYLVAKLRLDSFIVSLGAYILIGGLLTLWTRGAVIFNGIPASFGNWASRNWLGVPRAFIVLIVIAVATWYLLTQTPWGKAAEAIGVNEAAANLVGIRVNRVIWLSFIVSGLLAGAAGVLLTSRSAAGDPTAGASYLFPAFTALFLGATAIRPGRFNVWGTIVGVYFVGFAISGFSLLGADAWVQPTFEGGALILAVGLSTFAARQRTRRDASVAMESHDAEAG